jgi:primase-polymerase (primpol)-like protein
MTTTELNLILAELRTRHQSLVWRYEVRGGRRTKVAFRTTGLEAKSNDAATWCSFDEAATALNGGAGQS